MKNVAGVGDYLVLCLPPHIMEAVFLCVDEGNTRPVALLIHYLEGLVTNF